MKTRLFSHAQSKQLATALFFLFSVVSGLLVAGNSYSDDRVIETDERRANQPYQGTVNFVHQDSFEIVVDDQMFALPPVLQFNNASWSREQVVQRIKQGDLVEIELGDSAERDEDFSRTARSINVINR
ncbi:hypothetical protein FE845_15860 [Marinobacter sp. 1-4A]|uniref:hypothetical protein n=1 Tax=Marinobacter sp. 1-4A TaxID=2582919 RepID=UPI001902CDF4|nr:hypothetical protein [Marinobacter sp. 1-4A]MBK1852822.1 hypothetical protein [Marinobacter sp. 1-4A]